MAHIDLIVTSVNQIPYKGLAIKMRTSHINLETKNSISKMVIQFEQFGSAIRLYIITKKSTLQSSLLIKG